MERWRSWGCLAVAWIGAALASCGGGGSSSGTPFVPLRISPSSLSVTTTEGNTTTLVYTLTFDSSLTQKSFYIGIRDSGNSIDGNPSLSYQSATTASITFTSKTKLAQGVHTGVLDFYICNDSDCTNLLSNTPATVHYEITVQAAPPAATLDPAQLTVTAEEGDAITTSVKATLQTNSGGAVFVLSDPAGIFKPDVTPTAFVGQQYTLDLQLSPAVAAGSYSGTATLLICGSTPCTSYNTVAGGAIPVSYSVTITPFVIPPPTATASGLPEWETFQGNAGHTGYVPVTLDSAHFRPRWTWTAPAGVGTLGPATTGSGRLALSASGYAAADTLFVLNESDGSLAWSHDFGTQSALDDPGIYAGRVFLASTDETQHTFMWGFDLQNGDTKFQTRFMSQWDHYFAPTFHAGYLYTDGGSLGGIYAFKQTTGVPRWFVPLEMDDDWTPGVDDRFAYGFTAGRFHAVDIQTGTDFFVVNDPSFNWTGYTMNIAPVVTGEGHVLVVDGIYQPTSPNNLISYDITAQNEAWHIPGNFVANPVVAHGVIYALNANGNELEARDLSNGTLLWSWSPAGAQETMPVGNLVLTDNLIFLSTSAATYAIDLTTHQPVWNVALGGHLAMSSGPILYMVSPQGRVDAYDLR